MRPEYREWLQHQQYDENTIKAQLYRAERVEECQGNLDEHYDSDRMESLIQLLRYSSEDQRKGKQNPTRIPIDGHLQHNLASYRDAARRYRKFRDAVANGAVTSDAQIVERKVAAAVQEEVGQRIGLERDMQKALRAQIEQLEPGLTIIDEGAERSVESGFIDITAQDTEGRTVVIELKAGGGGRHAVGQILSYMGDIQVEEDGRVPRGILVASEFDTSAKGAARMVPSLSLKKYSVRFMFSDGHT